MKPQVNKFKSYRNICSILAIAGLLLIHTSDAFCFKPNTHIYTALEAAKYLLNNEDDNYVYIHGYYYPVDDEIADAIRSYPGSFAAGAIGPDGFPDILFGQSIMHPDLRCDYTSDNDGDCNTLSNKKSYSYDWLKLLYDNAQTETGESRKNALAFLYGFLIHAAGDMWSHTFVNQYAGGSWPPILGDQSNRGYNFTPHT